MYKFDNDMPIPASKWPHKLPFYDMQAGQSVFMKGKKREQFGSILKRLKDSNGWEFRTRTEGDGVRVWRVS